jgi:hypothetical protein
MGHWEMTTKVPKKEFKTWFPQHLSLGTEPRNKEGSKTQMLEEERRKWIQGGPRVVPRSTQGQQKTNKKWFKPWFPQHLSLGTKEQRRFQDSDTGE